jgi:hypothetical protein
MVPLGARTVDTPLLATINSDDPLTFATSLADEFAHIRFGLERQGVDAVEALDLLERMRIQSLRSRFTLPASCDDDALGALAGPGMSYLPGRPVDPRGARAP